MENEIIKFIDKNNQIAVEVQMTGDTVWLDQNSIANLFAVQQPAVAKHLSNIYAEGELKKDATHSKMELVQKEGPRAVTRTRSVYNLDAIISVGYRVNSAVATKFRIWATDVLRRYLVDGYSLDQRKIQYSVAQGVDIRKYLDMVSRINASLDMPKEGLDGFVGILRSYTKSLEALAEYDTKTFKPVKLHTRKALTLDYSDVLVEIDSLREELKVPEIFGRERETKSLESILMTVHQTFNKKDLYPSIEEKAANLLYLVIKNHPLVDGNKRVGSYMFVRYLQQNRILFRKDGSKVISENMLVTLALMVAQSDMKEKETITTLVAKLLVM